MGTAGLFKFHDLSTVLKLILEVTPFKRTIILHEAFFNFVSICPVLLVDIDQFLGCEKQAK